MDRTEALAAAMAAAFYAHEAERHGVTDPEVIPSPCLTDVAERMLAAFPPRPDLDVQAGLALLAWHDQTHGDRVGEHDHHCMFGIATGEVCTCGWAEAEAAITARDETLRERRDRIEVMDDLATLGIGFGEPRD